LFTLVYLSLTNTIFWYGPLNYDNRAYLSHNLDTLVLTLVFISLLRKCPYIIWNKKYWKNRYI